MTTGTIKVGNSVTGTSTTQSYNYTQPKIEYGWECPRCGHINAPWVRQCDCPRNHQSNTITWTTTGTSISNDDWQKTYINCQTDNLNCSTNHSPVITTDNFTTHIKEK